MEGNDAYIQYNVQGKENKYRNYFFVERDDSTAHTEEVFGYWIDPGETITCDIKITMVGGSLPTFKHAFIIDATEAEKTAPLVLLIEK